MNWLDIVVLAILAVGAFMGMRFGLIGAAITAAGVFIGWLLAGQWSDDIGALFGDSLSNDTLVTVVSYALILVAALVVTGIAKKVIMPLLTVVTLGLSSMVNKLGGLGLGLLMGIAMSGALIIGLARLTYDFDVDTIITESVLEQVPAQVQGQVTAQLKEQLAGQLSQVENAREALETALKESALVPVFINITDALPADALGFVPSDFKIALDILEERIE